MSSLPATELLPLPARGRTFTAARTVRLGDVDAAGELRLDAIARYLQDVATDDALDAGIQNAMGWLVRRTLIRVERPAQLNGHVELTTFCTGSGRSWAERRTRVFHDGQPCADAVCLWIQIDPVAGRPSRLDDEFFLHWGESAAGRVVSSRLSLPKAPADATDGRPWRFRTTDIDPFGHVNNAAQWSVVEEWLATSGTERRGIAELEYLAPIDATDRIDLVTEPAVAGTPDARTTGWLAGDGGVRSVWRFSAG